MDQSSFNQQQSMPGCSKNMSLNQTHQNSSTTDGAVAGGSSSANTYKNPVPSCSKNVSFAPTNCKNDNEKNHKLFLIVYKFLQQQLAESDNLSALQKESLEVTVQCLGYAFQFYEFDNPDNNLQTLYDFFEKHKNEFAHKKYEMDSDSEHEITPEDIVKAEEYKEKGNQFMREEKFQEALEFYDKAIRLNPDEPALYCNRAATYNNLKKFNEAIEDCNMALSLNRSYAKAYIRKGFAYERLKNNKKALKSYKKACQLEPENEHYKNMYTDASKRLKQKQDESTSTYNTMFLGPSVSSLPFGQLPEFDNLMQSLFSSVERQCRWFYSNALNVRIGRTHLHKMQCVIPTQNLKILARALHSLCRIGDELYVEPTKDGISFRTVNAAQSAYSSMFFNLSFFSRYKCDFQTEEAGTCKISMKACLRVFKTPHCMDRNVESCKIEIAEECLKLIFQIQYNQGYTKTHFLSVNDNETVQLKYSKTQMKNEVSILPRTLHRAVKYFGLKDEEITFDVTEDKVHLKNYFDNSEVENQKLVRTNFSLNRSDFETYNVSQPNSITFALRELRAVCAFSESSNSEIGIHFEMCGKPVIFTVENPLYQADYVVSTLPPEIISGGRPYRRSQLSDIASSIPSTSVVQSTKKRRLAPVSEETAEPIPYLSNESSIENNPIVHIVQADVHQPETLTSNVQYQSQNNATIVPQVQQLSQNNATNVSQAQQLSQNNLTNIPRTQQLDQNNETNVPRTQQPSQNNASKISQVQQPSQNNVPNIFRIQQFSQNNAASASHIQQTSHNITTNMTQMQRISQNNASNIAQVSSRCSFGPSNESDTNLDELMMKIDMNSEYFQDTNQKTINNELTGLTESQFQKIQHVYQYCMIFPTKAVVDEEVLCENDD